MNKLSVLLIFFLSVFSLSAQNYATYTYVVGDFELCRKNFVEQMPINEMSEESYRIFSNRYRKLPPGTYEFLVQYYSVFYGYESIDRSNSDKGFFMGNTTYSSKYATLHTISFTLDTVSDVTIKFNRNTEKIIIQATKPLAYQKPFVYLCVNSNGVEDISKFYMSSEKEFLLKIPFQRGSRSLKIAKDFNTPLQVNADSSNIITRGANPILFELDENTEITARIIDGKVCLSAPIEQQDSTSYNSDNFNLYNDPEFYDPETYY